MTRKLFFAAALALVAMSCSKKNETGSITTEETTTSNPETTINTTVTPIDSATSLKETQSVTTADQTTTTKTTTGEVYRYISNDGKTKFRAIYEPEKGTVVLKNETTGQTYNMKSVVSGSGSKYEDADKISGGHTKVNLTSEKATKTLS
ncbi:MliC family protein [Chryseobacterium taklimakanense]|uniref:Uncharacterized protein n=1 Tax=Chryseobacterium taklimakanense TaxID=536441 RepID=A0A3G8WIK2_9FLAO|nr:MliC family protein [Chryseobacterium taklimakanense]AZI21012.1 hypothetical protein EIH08_10200 [Chryseobacterium taklimakanense]